MQLVPDVFGFLENSGITSINKVLADNVGSKQARAVIDHIPASQLKRNSFFFPPLLLSEHNQDGNLRLKSGCVTVPVASA